MPTATTKPRILASPLYSSPIPTADGRILPTAGPVVCRWIETNLVYGEGDWQGQPFRIRPFQRRFLYRLYEYYPETGQRRYRRSLWGMGKGNGKTPIAAAIGAVELLSGITWSPHVIIGAASLKQANLVFGDLGTMISKPSPLDGMADVFDLQIVRRDAPGLAERIAAAEGTNDGARASTLLGDELHEWVGRIGRVWMIADGAVAKRRNGLSAAFSTASVDDEDTPLVAMYEHGKKVAADPPEVIDDRFLFEWYEAPAGLNLDDPDEWLEATLAANPAAGDMATDPDAFNDIEQLRYRFQTMARHEYERYHLNRFTKAEDIWEVAALWDALANPKVHLDRKRPLFVAVDVGIRHDGSAVVWAQETKSGRVVVRSRIWENPYLPQHANYSSWKLPIAEVVNQIRELRRQFPVAARDGVAGPAIFYDLTFFETQADDLADEGLNVIEFPQTDSRMIPASQRFFQLVKEGRLVHTGDAGLARHVGNVVPHEKPRGWRISKPKGSRKHIDAAVAAAMAAFEATREVEVEETTHILYVGEDEDDEE
jgi:phage terminase large subunit-like protein